MNARRRKKQPLWVRTWFGMTPHERLTVIAVAVILLIGITARCFYLKNQEPTPYDLPQPMESTGAPIAGEPGAEE